MVRVSQRRQHREDLAKLVQVAESEALAPVRLETKQVLAEPVNGHQQSAEVVKQTAQPVRSLPATADFEG